MTIDRLRAHWGFTRMPFAKDLTPSMLHSHRSHAEAAARITWCIDEQVVGVITGEVGSGKTVAVRAALAGIDASRHSVIYLGNPRRLRRRHQRASTISACWRSVMAPNSTDPSTTPNSASTPPSRRR